MSEKKFELTNLATGTKTTADIKSGTMGPGALNIASIAKDHGIWTFDRLRAFCADCPDQ